MAILVDLNQVMIANLMVQIGNHHNAEVDENMIRHMVLNSIRFNRMKFKDEFGELIICADDKNYWRRQMFPYYKAARRKHREESELDWTSIFNALNKVRQELKEVFPYKVIQIDGAEADDIIGTIIHEEGRELNTGEKFLILSGDKDYIQLHKYANIKQYNPVLKKWVVHSNPEQYLYEHIVKGDAGDGVPNILSPDNSFVMNIRQKPVTKKRLEEWIDINKMSSEVKRNYLRNKSLIDLSEVPQHLKEKILEAYSAENTKDRSQLLDFFIKNRLKLLTESLSEF
jgi:5'-3' exonuclease